MRKIFVLVLLLVSFGYGGEMDRLVNLNHKAFEAHKKGNYHLSIKYYNKILPKHKKLFGHNNKHLIVIYKMLAINYLELNNYKISLGYHYRILKLNKKVFGKNSIEVAKSYKDMFTVFIKQYDYKNAMKYSKKALKISLKYKKRYAYITAHIYYNMGEIEYSIGNNKNAIKYFEKSIKYSHSKKDRNNRIKTYSSISKSYREIYQYDEALKYNKKAFNLTKKNSIQRVNMYIDHAGILLLNGENSKALKYNNIALNILKKNRYKKEFNSKASAYNVQGMILKSINRYKGALIYFDKALKLMTDDSIGKWKIYENKAELFRVQGLFYKSIRLHKKSLDLKLKYLNKDDFEIATSYSKVANILSMQNMNIEAIKYYQKAIHIYEVRNRKNNMDLATIYSSLSMVLLFTHKDKEALNYAKKALKVYETKLPKNHYKLSEIYNNMGVILVNSKNFEESLKYFKKSISLLNKKDIFLGKIYLNMGNILSKKDKKESLKFYNKGINIFKNNSLENYEHIIDAYRQVALLNIDLNNYQLGYQNINKSFQSFFINRERNFFYLDDKQKKQYLYKNRYESQIDILLIMNYYYIKKTIQYNTTDINLVKEKTLSYWINYKGTISESSNLLKMIEQKANKETKKDIKILRELTISLSNLYQNTQKDNSQQIKIIEKKISQLQIKLNNNIKAFREFNNLKNISIEDISKTLKDDELYIDFAKTDENYYIFTLNKDLNISYKQINIEDTKLLEQKIQKFRKNNKNEATKSIKETQKTLNEIYNILAKYINFKSKKSLIISPDGLLNFLPFEALYDGEKYLVESVNISYIPSGRELVRQSRREQSTNNSKDVVVFGNIDYGLNDDTSSDKKSLNLMNYLPQLTSSKEEIDTLYKLYPKAIIYQDKMATVENLFKIKSPKILHLSTHGKFVDDKNTTNPMQQTILAFSDANYAILEKNYRGIATALKLSSLSLNNTELVFLSACETGLGTVQTAEGVQGLPKAFIQAGAKNIIMSLWQVDDSKTTELTRYFYENIKSGMGYKEALREAKLKMIDMHPYYWSGFVFSGLDI